MGARASVFNFTTLGVETTKGTRIQTVRRLPSTGFVIKPNVPIKPFTPVGTKYPTTAVGGKEHTMGDIQGTAAFNDMLWLLSSVCCNGVVTTPSGATLTRQWAFNPVSRGPDTISSFTVEMGSSVEAERAVDCLIDGITLKVMKEEASITGTILGKIMSEQIVLSAGRDQVYTISMGTNTGGTFTLTVGANTTAGIPQASTHGTVQTAITGLASVGANNAVVTGPVGGPWVVTFAGALAAQAVTMTASFASLTGGAGATITSTIPGIAMADTPEVPMDPEIFSVFVGDNMNNDVQTIAIQASGGTFTLTFVDPQGVTATTTALAWNITKANLQTALIALSNINSGDVVVTGTDGGPWILTFGGRFANLFLAPLTYDDGLLTGTTVPALAVTHTTSGGLSLLQKCLEFEWSLTGRYQPEFTLRADDLSWTDYVEVAPKHELTLVVEHDSTAAAYMGTMRAKATKYIRLANIGPLIETVGTSDYFYWFRQTWAFKFDANDRSDQGGVWGSTFKLCPMSGDPNFTGHFESLVWTTLTSLEA